MQDTRMKDYQKNFSQLHPEIYLGGEGRGAKAAKMVSILRDAMGQDLASLHALDIGCSTGAMCRELAPSFGQVTGIDIDEVAIDFARKGPSSPSLDFRVGDAMATGLPGSSVDVVICAHVYEHVPDPFRMMEEIKRVLRPGGACFFAAENRLVWREGDYRLPLLSVMPKWLGNHYIRLAGKADHYYETLFTYWQLVRLVDGFERIDYTRKVVASPGEYCALDMITPDSWRQKLALGLIDHAYWLFPNYLWVLRKPED